MGLLNGGVILIFELLVNFKIKIISITFTPSVAHPNPSTFADALSCPLLAPPAGNTF